jgi:phage tail protein X
VLRLNPGLADLGVLLPEGTRVQLPDNLPAQPKLQTIQLWS